MANHFFIDYYLGKYRFRNFKIQKRIFLWFYKNIDNHLYSRDAAIQKINRLCKVTSQKPIELGSRITPSVDLSGKYLVNFKRPGKYFFRNDPLPATIRKHDDTRINVKWDNGESYRGPADELVIYNIPDQK